MSVLGGNPLLIAGDDAYQISRSVRLRSSASAYLTRTLGSNSTSQTTMTWSGWVKRGALGAARAFLAYHGNVAASGNMLAVEFVADTLRVGFDSGLTTVIQTSAVYRDPSAWYHVLVVYDSTQTTASNRAKLYVNGSQITAFSTANYPALNQAINAASTNVQNLGNVAGLYLDGYLTEVNFIDGQALTPSSFGQTDLVTGVWGAKKYAGTYGTNGFYLNFKDPASTTTIGYDYSGNSNNWTPNNISVTAGVTYDSMIDVPTMYVDGGNGRGNYPVINPLTPGASSLVSNGNLQLNPGGGNGYATFMLPSSGKWYFEASPTNSWYTGSYYVWGGVGIITNGQTFTTNFTGAFMTSNVANGQIAQNGTSVQTYTSWATNDVIGIAVDMGAGTMSVYRNNTLLQSGLTLPPGDICFYVYTFGGSNTIVANFGQQPFTYTPPTGFKALNTQNLPDATVKAGNKYFDASLYTGTNATQSINNSGAFQPDLVWAKGRSYAGNQILFDSIRGVNQAIFANLTNAELTQAASVTSFNAGGFSVGADANNNVNKSAESLVAWQWKKGASQGFDIVTYTGNGTAGRTVAHSLGVAPKFIITKHKDAADNWAVYHASLGTGTYGPNYLFLNSIAAQGTTGDLWRAPTSTNMIVGSDNLVNVNAGSYVSYLFAEVAGFSKFGGYTGNGSADGPFVYLGFRPRYVMVKGSSAASSWQLFDTLRPGYNANDNTLWADLSSAEGTGVARIDLLSNGFKVRAPAGTDPNVSSATYIFAAFAENPFKNSLAR